MALWHNVLLFVFLYLQGCDRDSEIAPIHLMGGLPKKPISQFVTGSNEHLVEPQAISLVERQLRYDHQERLTVKEAIAHPLFKSLNMAEDQP
jgi:hypothetical protein